MGKGPDAMVVDKMGVGTPALAVYLGSLVLSGLSHQWTTSRQQRTAAKSAQIQCLVGGSGSVITCA